MIILISNQIKNLDRYNVIARTMDYVISLGEDERQRFVKTVTELGKAFALCATEETAQELNSEIAFLKAVKAGIIKLLAPPPVRIINVKNPQLKLKLKLIN